MAQLEAEGMQEEQKIAPAAVVADDDKALMKDNLRFSISAAQQKIIISVRDTVTKRLFNGSFTLSQLIEFGFFKTQTLPTIEKVIISSIDGSNEAVHSQIGYLSGEETNGNVKKRYTKGDRLVLSVTHVNDFFPLNAKLPLLEAEQSEVDLLSQMVEDLRTENATLTKRLSEMETKIEERDQRLERMIEEQKEKVPEVGSWHSSTAQDANYYKWDSVKVAPPPNLFQMNQSDSEIQVMKQGLYRVSVAVESITESPYVVLQLNGSNIHMQHQYGSARRHRGHAFVVYRTLQQNDKLRVNCNAPYFQTNCNALTIERL